MYALVEDSRKLVRIYQTFSNIREFYLLAIIKDGVGRYVAAQLVVASVQPDFAPQTVVASVQPDDVASIQPITASFVQLVDEAQPVDASYV